MSIFPFWFQNVTIFSKGQSLKKSFRRLSCILKTSREWGGGGGIGVETPSSPSKLWLKALFRSISIHKTVLNFMRNGPFGRASVHLNNGQGILRMCYQPAETLLKCLKSIVLPGH